MKQILIIFLFLSFWLCSFAEVPPFFFFFLDYSRSWTSTMHYSFSDEEMSVVKVDNVEKSKTDTLSHRELLGKEKEAIYRYLSLISQIQFQSEYKDLTGGDRNQKRVIFNLDGVEQSVLVSNTYQQDIAGLVTFLNTFVSDKRKMKEFVDPNKPSKQPQK